MAKFRIGAWGEVPSRIIGVPKKRWQKKEKEVKAEDFSAFRRQQVQECDVPLIQKIVNEMASIAAIDNSHEDELWAAAADGVFQQTLESATEAAQSEEHILPDLYDPELEAEMLEEEMTEVDTSVLGWGDLAMDDYDDEEELIAELNARAQQDWE